MSEPLETVAARIDQLQTACHVSMQNYTVHRNGTEVCTWEVTIRRRGPTVPDPPVTIRRESLREAMHEALQRVESLGWGRQA